MMGLIFAKLWSLFCNQGEEHGAAQRLDSGAEGPGASGAKPEAALPAPANVLRR